MASKSHGQLLLSVIPIIDQFDGCLVCPKCGFDFIHPVSVRCNPAGETLGEVVIEKRGVYWDGSTPPDGRGVVMELVFTCEAGCVFGYEFRFHKGYTLVSRKQHDDDPGLPTIWRN